MFDVLGSRSLELFSCIVPMFWVRAIRDIEFYVPCMIHVLLV